VLTAHALAALVVAFALAGLLSRGLGRLGLLDRPNARSSHQRPTPRGGGLAFLAPSCLVAPVPLLLMPLPLALVGLLDDRKGLPVRWRLLVQLLTGLALALQAGWPPLPAAAAAIVAAALINAVNFTDGLDGLVASCLALWLLLAALLLQQPALLVLAAAVLGFLAWNWSPARLFMGDVGSTYLGAVLAGVLLLAARRHPPLLLAGLLLAALPLLADAFSCLLRRLLAGQRLWQAHRLHLYQRLQQAGWTHQRVAGVYAAATALLAGVAWWAQQLRPESAWGLLLATGVLTLVVAYQLDRRVAVPFD